MDMGPQAAYTASELADGSVYRATLASLSDPKQKLGLYWGYQTRIATSVQDLLGGGPYKVFISTQSPNTGIQRFTPPSKSID